MIPVQIKLDASTAMARFSDEGIPAAVRRNLRRVLPDLTKRLGAQVDQNLAGGLRSRNRLQTKTELVENPTTVYGRVRVVATEGPSALPRWLESGTRPHPIYARNATALRFFWERMGAWVMFKQVWHPGFPGIFYMQNAFQELEGEIIDGIRNAVSEGLRGR